MCSHKPVWIYRDKRKREFKMSWIHRIDLILKIENDLFIPIHTICEHTGKEELHWRIILIVGLTRETPWMYRYVLRQFRQLTDPIDDSWLFEPLLNALIRRSCFSTNDKSRDSHIRHTSSVHNDHWVMSRAYLLELWIERRTLASHSNVLTIELLRLIRPIIGLVLQASSLYVHTSSTWDCMNTSRRSSLESWDLQS